MPASLTEWDLAYVTGQRAVFSSVWREHVGARLAGLNALDDGSRTQRAIPTVGPMRAAALYASEWMRTPVRLAGACDNEDESDANRAAIRTILELVRARLSHLPPEVEKRWARLVMGLDLELADHLARHPRGQWRRVQGLAREYGVEQPAVGWAAFRAAASETGLVVGRDQHDYRTRNRSGAWLPVSAEAWFNPAARLISRPSREKRHAVVDAFFHDEYRRLDPSATSPVQLLATYPPFELVARPDVDLPAAEFGRACRDADLTWRREFTRALERARVLPDNTVPAYPEGVARAEAYLRAAQDDVAADGVHPVSEPSPAVALLTLVADHVDGLDISPHELERRCGVAARRTAGTEHAVLIRDVLDHEAAGRPEDRVAGIARRVVELPVGHSAAVLRRLLDELDIAGRDRP